MKKIIINISFLILLAGCGTTTSRIVPAGNDTYFISGHGYAKEAPEAMTALYREANDYCHKNGKKFIPVSTDSQKFDIYSSSVSMHFRCLMADDQELERPVMRHPPNTIIEVHTP